MVNGPLICIREKSLAVLVRFSLQQGLTASREASQVVFLNEPLKQLGISSREEFLKSRNLT
jgi:hypothetical protein